MKTDITMYSDQELSLLFDNDEGLYYEMERATRFNEVEALADELFIYTNDQLLELEETFESMKEEEERETQEWLAQRNS